jgi:hypothetical protein
MMNRCYNEDNIGFNSYGGRGITVCKGWRDSVKTFFKWATSNGYSGSLTLERKNVDGDYKPSNCTWVSMQVQQNNRTNNLNLTIDGETHTVMEWSRLTGIPRTTLQNRYYSGKRGSDLLISRRK